MRVFYILCYLLVYCVQFNAQVVQIEYNGDPLATNEREKVEKVLLHQAEFYSQFGMPDTLTIIQLYVFEKKEAAWEYLKSLDVDAKIPKSATGLYIAAQQRIIIFGIGTGRKRNLNVIYHELSHHFTCQILGERIPLWINEGLSEYFENCVVTKKEIRHVFTEVEQSRILTMYMLEEIDLPNFVCCSPSVFMMEQSTNDEYSYILAHALIMFWIEQTPKEVTKKFLSSFQNENDSSSVYERINNIYPGGFRKFEKDFATYINNMD